MKFLDALSPRHGVLILFIGALFLAGALSATAQNLISNGDFESGPFNGPGAIPSWTVGGNKHIDTVTSEGTTSPIRAAAFGVAGSSDGNVLSQTFNTVAGTTYVLDFDCWVYGQRTGSPLQFHIQVLGNATLFDLTVAPPDALTFNPSAVIFQHFHRTFVADRSTATLQFSDIGLGNASADILLDTVSVAPMPPPTPTPTPTMLPLNNANFEAAPFNQTGTITGWVVSGTGRIEEINQGSTSGIRSAGFSIGGDYQNSVLSQTFITIPNQTYTVDFDAGIYGQRAGLPLQLRAQVLGNSTLLNQVVTPPDASTFNPFNVVFQHYHFTFIADGTTATIQFSDPLGGNSGADPMLDTVVVAPVPPSFAQWQIQHFTAAQRNDPNVSGWTADPDRDGIPNGLEYFFNTDPMAGITSADSKALPQISISVSGTSQYLTYTFHRCVGWSGNAAVLAVSDNLASWDTTQTQVEGVGSPVPAGDGVTEIVTMRLKTPINQGPIPKKDFRLLLAP